MSEKSDLDLTTQNEVFHLEIHQDEQSHRLPLTKKIFIGSSADADLKISEAQLLPKHILIQLKNELPTLKIAASNDLITLNQAKLSPNQDYLLKENDQINISSIVILIKKYREENEMEMTNEKTMVQKIATAFTSVSSLLKMKKNSESNSGLKMEGTRTKVTRAIDQLKESQKQAPTLKKITNHAKHYEPANILVRLFAFILDLAMAYAFAVTLLPLLLLEDLWPTLSRELLKQIPIPADFFIDVAILQDIFPSYLLFYISRLFFVLVFKKSFGQLLTGMKLAESGILERIKAIGVWLIDVLFSWTLIANLPTLIKKRSLKEFLLRTTFNSPSKIWSYANWVTVPIVSTILFFSPLALTTNIIFSPISEVPIKSVKFEEIPDSNAQYIFMAQSGLLKWIGRGAYFKDLIEKKYLILPTLQDKKLRIHIFDKIKKNQVIYLPETSKKDESISWPLLLEEIFLNNYTPFLTCAEFPTNINLESPLPYNAEIKMCLKSLIISSLKVSSDQFTNPDFWLDNIFKHGPFPTTLTAMQNYLTIQLPKKLNLGELTGLRFVTIQNTEYLELKTTSQAILLNLDEASPRPLRFETKIGLDQIYRDIFTQVQSKQSEANLLNPAPTINLFAPLDEMFALVNKKIKILEGDRAQNLLQFFTWQQDHLGDFPEARELYKKSLEDFMALQEGQILSKSLQELLNKLEQPAAIPSNEEAVHE
jgi:hypothetical protein